MGLKTLAEFKTLVTSAIGRSPSTTVLDFCVNSALLDVASAIDLAELDSRETKITSIGVGHVTLTDTNATLAVRLVYSDSLKSKLDYMELADFYSHELSDAGVPLRWTRDNEKILLHPTPNAVISHLILTKLKPVAFAGDATTSGINEIWDYAIELFAMAHAFDSIGEQDRGQYWRQNGVQYCMTRLSEGDFVDRVSGLSRSMPTRQGAQQS